MRLHAVEHAPVAESWRFNPAENPLVRAIGRIPVSVRTKLLAGFAVIALLLVVVGLLGLLALGRSSSRVERLGTLRAHAAAYQGLQTDVGQLEDLVLERQRFTENAGTPLGRDATTLPSTSFLVIDETVRQALTTFVGDAAVLEDADPALFRQVFAIYLRFHDKADAALRADHAGTGAAAGRLVRQELALAGALAPLMDDVASRTRAQADALVAQNRRSFTNSRNLFIGVAAASVIFALALGFVLSWSLIVPLQRTEARLAKIAAGDFSGHVEVVNRDEIGELAANVNRMNDELGRLYRELETVSRHKSDFLANMSHELRTPLNAIIGFSEVLHEQMFGELNEQQLGYVDDVLLAGRHLLSLINDVLDLAKIEAGRMELDLAEVSVPDILRSGMSMHGERASRAGVGLGLTVEPEQITIEADERRVRQVVFNLLSNAMKFTPRDGRIDVSARLLRRDRGGRRRRHRRGHSSRGSRPDLRGVRAGEGTAPAAARTGRGSGSRFRASSSSCTAAASGSRAGSVSAARSSSHCPSSRRRTRWPTS